MMKRIQSVCVSTGGFLFLASILAVFLINPSQHVVLLVLSSCLPVFPGPAFLLCTATASFVSVWFRVQLMGPSTELLSIGK